VSFDQPYHGVGYASNLGRVVELNDEIHVSIAEFVNPCWRNIAQSFCRVVVLDATVPARAIDILTLVLAMLLVAMLEISFNVAASP
jgi:hypothetical protein